MTSASLPRSPLGANAVTLGWARAATCGTAAATALLLVALLGVVLAAPAAAEAACPATGNAIVLENCKPGSPAEEWDVPGAGDPAIQGFATDISVDRGRTVTFKVDTASDAYRLDIYRMGWYGGDGARKVATVRPSATLPQRQPECLTDADSGLVDCGNWDISASWDVPADAVSGIYFAKLVREDVSTSVGSHIVFIVRDDPGTSDLLFQTSDTTWQAYNRYGGNSLYVGGPGTNPGRAYKVSYNRPFTTRGTSNEDWVFNAEYPMVRFLERNGYDVSYFTGVDSDRNGDLIRRHRTFLSVGHDEYWSGGQRRNVEAARDAGVNLAFFSGNESFWKARWEPSIAASGDDHRTLVSYKETSADAKIDPKADTWTGTWRDPRAFNPEGPHPENALTGTIFTVNSGTSAITVPAEDGRMRLWRGTSVAGLGPGQVATLAPDTLGYEWDEDLDNGARPAGLVQMSSSTVDNVQKLLDNGSTYGNGSATHHLTVYRQRNTAAPDALVFGAGTVQWPWGLDDAHDRGGAAVDSRMQQATVNLLADMGAHPATLEDGLAPATPSLDAIPAGAAVTAPDAGATIEQGRPITVTGTATDIGGAVGGVEVSVDGGAWHPATGRDTWRYTFTPSAPGDITVRARAVDDSGNLQAVPASRSLTVAAAAPQACPCTIFDDATAPASAAALSDGQPIEVGTRFRADEDGFVTGLRFYKAAGNGGTHVGHLWSADGAQLAEATFDGESASGWQEVRLAQPVAVTKGTTYVASYHSSAGSYSADNDYFASQGVDAPPLHALADGADGANGVYAYGPSSFPNQTFGSSNYWVDVVFDRSVGPDTTAPKVSRVQPSDTAADVDIKTKVTATFDEPVDPATVRAATFSLTDAGGTAVEADVAYSASTRTATLTPSAPLQHSTFYTATVRGGAEGVADTAGNALAADRTWSFTTAAAPPAPPDDGPGGPILVAADGGDPFGRYYGEILRSEGLNDFKVTDLSNVSASTLAGYEVLILAQTSLSDAQVAMLTDWVRAGGNLVAMRPDAKLSALLGLGARTGTLADQYVKVDTTAAPGAGITADTMQFHGTADLYGAGSARTVAALYSSPSQATSSPAVTVSDVGASGGQAAAFAYDLARSVVWTRQGNPAWAGQERDGQDGPIRSDDLFFGARAGDVQPDWVNLDKVAIPQADEQQRLLVNLITEMNRDRTPLPRFWYLPRGEKAAVVMTGDDHGNNGTEGQFQRFEAASPAGCSVADWQCIRATSYLYPGTPMSDATAARFQAEGFEIGMHTSTSCGNYTPASLEENFSSQLSAFAAGFPSVTPPVTNRTHCIAWSDWVGTPKTELAHGIRFDTNYYYWPASWIQDRPGMFTGSGMPMRFADENGALVDVYQAATQMPDESGQNTPVHIKALIDGALGASGYYGVFTMNMHTDTSTHAGADAVVAEAKARGVPVVSAKQMLTWLDGRNGSSFRDVSSSAGALRFTVAPGAGARGLQAMVPVASARGPLARLSRDGQPVATTTRTVKGVDYVVFAADAGAYVATYEQDTTAPSISGVTATAHDDGTATVTWKTDEPATSHVRFGTSADALDRDATDGALVTDHSVTLTGLEPSSRVLFRVSSTDASGNSATAPAAGDPPADLTTPAASLVDTTVEDFRAGSASGVYAGATGSGSDGEVVLAPAVAEDFSAAEAALPAGWSANAWPGGEATTDSARAAIAGGALVLDGARAGTDATFDRGRALEFEATFGAAPFQHVGLGVDYNDAPWAMFSTKDGSGLYARTSDGTGAAQDTLVAGVSVTVPHRYRIEWNASSIDYYVDGAKVATHTATFTVPLRPLASDFTTGGPTLSVDWLRLTPHAANGTLTSRVLDAGRAGAAWQQIDATADTPAGTAIAFETRSGDSGTPDDTWSEWRSAGPGGAIASPAARYVQYRATLSGGSAFATPTLQRVAVGFAARTGSAPVAGTVSLAPASPKTGDVLSATPTGFTDADGDELTYAHRWLRNGTPIAGETGDTLDLSKTGNGDHGDRITVEVVASDGHGGTSATASDSVTVANTAPVTGSVSITPAAPGTDDTLTATPSAFTDADGDTLTYRYRWLRNGTAIDGETASTLDLSKSGNGDAGDSIAVEVRADDGHGATTDAVTDRVTVSTAARVVDTTTGDFAAGTFDGTSAGATGAEAGTAADGEVTLKPAVGEEFEGSGLPLAWQANTWPEALPTVLPDRAGTAGGALVVDGAAAGTAATFGPGGSLEFAATFAAVANQHVGLGVDYNNAPAWAMFSTGSSSAVGLYARTNAGTEQTTPITGVSATEPHRYRIDWTAAGVDYWVDGVKVASHSIAPAGELRPLVSDFEQGGATLAVHWLRLTPYTGTGTFTSRVLDAGGDADWQALAADTATPAGTTAAFETRSGSTAQPDDGWSAWAPVGADGAIASPHGRFLQYRVALATTDPARTPAVERVSASVQRRPENRAPVAGTVSVSPAAPGTDATLTAKVDGFSDPDGDTLTYAYRWLRNGTPIAGESGDTLDLSKAGRGDRGDEIGVEVVADDGHGAATPAVTDRVTVANTAPVRGTVTLDPAAPVAGGTLTATVDGFTDADGDTLTYRYRWLRNGTAIDGADAATLALSGPVNGDVIRVEVIASDGHGGASAVAAAEVTVGNVAPHIGTVALSPVDPGTNAVVTAKANGFSDPDGDTLTYRYSWFVNGAPIAGESGDALDLSKAGHGDHGDEISVEVVVEDGHGASTAAVRASVTVANTVPTDGTVTIDPAAPTTADRLTATADGFRDADGDALVYRYAWTRNGQPIGGPTDRTISPPSDARAGDVVAVTVTADDGHGGSAAVTAAVTLRALATPADPGAGQPADGGQPATTPPVGSTPTTGAPGQATSQPGIQVLGGTVPGLRLQGTTRQRVLRTRSVAVRVRCDAKCTVRAQGRLWLAAKGRHSTATSVRTAAVRRSLVANRSTTLRVRLSRSAIASIKRAMARGRVARIRVTVTVTGAQAQARSRTLAVRVVR